MKTLLVVCHPDTRSFSHAVGQEVESACRESGTQVARRYLYGEEFSPVLSAEELARHYSFDPRIPEFIAEVQAADHLAIIHPDWWSGPPALLKGWIDRVFIPGIAYEWAGEEFGEKHHRPLLAGRSATVYIPTNRTVDDQPEALRIFWTDLCAYAGIELCGFTLFPELHNSSFAQRRKWLEEVHAGMVELAGREAGRSDEEVGQDQIRTQQE